MQATIQFRAEQQTGEHTYAVEVRSQPESPGQSANKRVTVELVGVQQDGTVIAEGGLVLPSTDLVAAGQLIEQSLHGLAVLHGNGKATSKQRSSPANAGTPWTKEQDAQLRMQWLQGETCIADLSNQLGRSRWAIRARLIHVGCDPDQVGEPNTYDTPTENVEQEFGA